jgi:aspartyl-tRNA(Asn)/glutamyl-tRNA(Gln) amidotransferase subunit B
MGYPGTLPSLNIEAMRMGCIVALALNCRIPEKTWFERKQYFYPDMPKNYQITQFASPLGQKGYMDIEGRTADGISINKRIRIKECHLEEDSGKMIHTGDVTLLDYNRAGVSLLEIVTEPDLETGEEAEVFLRQLRRMVRYLGVCDGNMEEGSLRADANVSVNFRGQGLGKKVELKNLNSSRFVRLALNYEIARHKQAMDEEKEVIQETRLWNEGRGETVPMRRKENARDYRYFCEPDLPAFTPDAAFLKTVRDSSVELPAQRMKRFQNDYSLSAEQADLVCCEKEEADYFEDAVSFAVSQGLEKTDAAARIANYLLSVITHMLHRGGLSPRNLASFPLTPQRLAEITEAVSKGRLSTGNAREALELCAAENRSLQEIIRDHGWELLSDPTTIAAVVREVFEEEASVFAEAASTDNPKRRRVLASFLAGKVLKKTGGRADPKIVREQTEKALTRNPR